MTKEETKIEEKPQVKKEIKQENNTKETVKEKVFKKKFDNKKRFEQREDFHKKEIEKPVFVKKKSPFAGQKLFNKWAIDDVIVKDLSLVRYINLDPVIFPHSFGRKSQGRFAKQNINVVERLINKSMRSGQGKRKLSGKYIRGRGSCGKKLQVMKNVEGAFQIIEEKTKKNPVQVLVEALENAAPHEDVTRVKRGGVAYSVAVDVSPMKGLDEAIKNVALAGFGNSFNNKTNAAQALAEEIIAAAANDAKSIAVKRKYEVERIAKASR